MGPPSSLFGSLVAEARKAHLNPEAGPLSCPDISRSSYAASIMFLPCVLVLAWADPLCMRQTHFCMVQKREADRGHLSLGRSQEPATTTQRFSAIDFSMFLNFFPRDLRSKRPYSLGNFP